MCERDILSALTVEQIQATMLEKNYHLQSLIDAALLNPPRRSSQSKNTPDPKSNSAIPMAVY